MLTPNASKNPVSFDRFSALHSVRAVVATLAILGSGGCADEGAVAPENDTSSTKPPPACTSGGRNAPGCTIGTLIDPEGGPVSGVRVSACTPSTCITGTTDDAGDFIIQGLPVEPHKLEVLGFIRGFFTTIYYLEMRSGLVAKPEKPIQLQRLPAAMVKGFEPAVGGELALAEGDVKIDADPGSLSFPIGTIGDGAEAAAVDPLVLPTFDIAPWTGLEADSFAYTLHPFPLRSDGGVEIALRVPDDRIEAASYRLYSVHTSSARVEDVGLLERGDDGLWRLSDPTLLRHLAILVAVPAL